MASILTYGRRSERGTAEYLHLSNEEYIIAHCRLHAACAAVAVILLVGCGSRAESGPVLAVDRMTHEFAPGRDWVPSTEFVLKNVGSAPLTIERIEPSCGCTTADLAKSELAVGEKTVLRVHVNRPPIGSQKATVSISSNSTKNDPASIAITCWAYDNRPRLADFKPKRIWLRNLDVDDAPDVKIVAFERANQRLISSAYCDLPFVGVVQIGADERPFPSPEFVQREYRFIVALMDPHPFGRFQGLAKFQMAREEGDTRPAEFTLPIDVVAMPPLYADPDVLFATITVGSPLPTWSVKLKRRSAYVRGKAASATCTAAWLAVELQDVALGSAAEGAGDTASARKLVVRVVAAPPSSPSRAMVTVKCDDPEAPAIEIPIVVTGGGPAVASDGGK